MVEGLPGTYVRDFVRSVSAEVVKPVLRETLFSTYVERQILLHLPAFSADAIRNDHRQTASRLKSVLHERFTHASFSAWRPISTCDSWRFGEVPPDLGLSLQHLTHYMHCPRSDTLLHYGAYQGPLPGLYLAFSRCDREYLWVALTRYLESCRLPVPSRTSVVVLTRATATEQLPKNLVSTTVSRASEVLASTFSAHLCLTAVNPFLGFDGASMRASGFVPFTLSPMAYLYDDDLLFTSRRTAPPQPTVQKLRTPPIVWLVKPVSRRYRSLSASFETRYLHIKDNDYRGRQGDPLRP